MPINSFDSYPLSWKPDKEACRPPYYRSLAEDLERKIRSGLLTPGTLLPPQREIADYLDLNYTTITRVYDLCKKKGLIYGVTGRGTFVAPHSGADITITGSNLATNCIELGMISSFCEYTPYVEKAATTVLNRGALRTLLNYDAPEGLPHQRMAAVRWMEQFGVHSDVLHTAILPGAQNAIAVAMTSLFHAGDGIATDPYTYPNVIGLAKMLDLKLIPVAGDENGMRPEALERQCRQNRIRGMFLMPSGSNPCNTYMPEERRRALVEVIQAHDLTVIEDDIASWLRVMEGKSAVPSMFDLLDSGCVHISGAAKNICPGMRIAFVAFREDVRERFLHGQFNVNVKASSLDAEIISELVLSGDAYKTLLHKYDMTERACRAFRECFPEYDDGVLSYHKWFPVQLHKPYAQVERELAARGARAYLSERFAVADHPDTYIRLSVASAGSLSRLQKGLGIVRTYLKENEMLL